ncbi:hypothetical protein [Kribbella sp. VKM Ac-2568]|uniref:hypothetical protein n=1 Tax=Kribbella sp. VKM Ac-2568 TaxID=2512219 RepID=UPI0010526C17|nr:hypothetical protein [Kribbella sp. VKM Ac-2568]
MTTTEVFRRSSAMRLVLPAGVGAAAVAVSAVLPQEVHYDKGMAPLWVPAVAAVLAVCSALLTARRLVLVCGWTGAVLFLWAAGGVVLDAFRAFYWATGIPAGEFAQVDWPGALRRFVSLLAAAVVGAGTLRYQRATSDGRAPRQWGSSWLGYAAFAVGFPYPMLKLYWCLGGSIARPAVYTEGFPVMELVCLVAGASLSLALAQSWGRRLPRRLVLAPAWFATAALVSMAALMVFGTASQLLGITDGPVDFGDTQSLVAVGTVYLSWLVFGLTLGGATLAFQRATGPVDR